MKRIRNWMETKIARGSATIDADELRSPAAVAVKPAEKAKEEYVIEQTFGAEYQDRLENNIETKDISMPDIYCSEDTVAQKQLNVRNETPRFADESAGFDPYDTGRLEISKIQNSRSKK